MPTAWLDLPAPPALPGLFLRAALCSAARNLARICAINDAP